MSFLHPVSWLVVLSVNDYGKFDFSEPTRSLCKYTSHWKMSALESCNSSADKLSDKTHLGRWPHPTSIQECSRSCSQCQGHHQECRSHLSPACQRMGCWHTGRLQKGPSRGSWQQHAITVRRAMLLCLRDNANYQIVQRTHICTDQL